MDFKRLSCVLLLVAVISLVCNPASVTAGDIVHDDDSAPKKPGCENDFVLSRVGIALSFMMSPKCPNSTIGDELKFQQRWEFRRKDNDFDSSSDDSKSSSMGQTVIKKHKLASSLISLYDDDTSNTSRLDQNHNGNPGFGDQLEFAKGKEKKIKKGRKKSFADSEVKRDCQNEFNRKKSKRTVYDPAAIDDVKNFMESLLEDLKVTRENLFTWMEEEMNKLVAGDNAPKKGRRKRNLRGNNVQSQQCNKFKKNVQLQQQNSIEENVRVQHQNNSGVIVHAQQKNNFEEDTEVQYHKSFKSGMRDQKGIGGFLKRVTKSIKSFETSDHVACGQATGPVTSLEKEKGERLALTVKSNPQSGPSNQNARVQHSKSVVLAIRAQNCNDGSSDRSVKGKKTVNSDKHYQAPEDRIGYSQAIGSLISTGKEKAERLRLSGEQSFSPNPTNQVASSMYLTLPTVLTKSHDSNNWLDTFLSNYIQPRVSGNKTSVTLEGAKQMHDSSTHFGYLPNIQPEDRSANFSQLGSRNSSCFNHNGSQTSSTGTGFPVPLHQGISDGFSLPNQFLLQNIPQESGNTLGLRMNGGAITFSGGSYALSENFFNNNLPIHSNYRADGRLIPYQIPSITDGYLFPK